MNEREVEAVCNLWHKQAKAIYNEEFLKPPKDENSTRVGGDGEGGEEVDDDLYQTRSASYLEMGRASTSTLQRRLQLAWIRPRSAVDRLIEGAATVGPPDGSKPREVKSRGWMKEYDDSMK